jgi:hypothetical protein
MNGNYIISTGAAEEIKKASAIADAWQIVMKIYIAFE